MMANNSNPVAGTSSGPKTPISRQPASPVEARPAAGASGAAESRDDGDSFGARMQDAANAKREVTARQQRRCDARADARGDSNDASHSDTAPAAEDDGTETTAAGDARASAVAAGTTAAAQRTTDQQAQKQDAAATDAAALAAQLAALLAPAAADAPAVTAGAAGPSTLKDAAPGSLEQGAAAIQDGATEASQPKAGAAFSLERYARELERAAVAPLPETTRDSRSTPAGESDGKASGPVAALTGGAANMNAALQALTDNLALHRSAAQVAPRSLEASVGSKAWQEQLGSQLTWMIDKGEQLATLRLSPEHLGPLEVKIAVRESEATVWFGATQPETRAALEAAMPRLRDMLASQGIALLQSGVSSGSPRNPQRDTAGANRFGGVVATNADPGVTEVKSLVGRGLVDLYA